MYFPKGNEKRTFLFKMMLGTREPSAPFGLEEQPKWRTYIGEMCEQKLVLENVKELNIFVQKYSRTDIHTVVRKGLQVVMRMGVGMEWHLHLFDLWGTCCLEELPVTKCWLCLLSKFTQLISSGEMKHINSYSLQWKVTFFCHEEWAAG
jgi:hypothetical protein